jgi:D-sedoheptulose 7-phosphate isomerase
MNDYDFERVCKCFDDSIWSAKNCLSDAKCIGDIAIVSRKLTDIIRDGGSVAVFGNGGSATDAQHFVGELVGKFKFERSPIKAMCLSDNIASLTAIANDYTYSSVFSRQVEAFVKSCDMAIGISTSGKSLNVINALIKAKEIGSYTVLLTGDNELNYRFVDVTLIAKSKDTPIIQNIHIIILHSIAMIVEENLFKG